MSVSSEFDSGPPPAVAAHFAALPSYAAHREYFWYDWGPVFYRGRLDRSAKVLGVASDPGPTEQVACRTLVGDAGQRVQGFLTKLGLTRSYVLVNAHPYALHQEFFDQGKRLLDDSPFLEWRNELLDLIVGPSLQAIVAFGAQAQRAVQLRENPPAGISVENVPHPSNHNEATTATAYAAAVARLRSIVTPDPGGSTTGPNYSADFTEADYAAIPRHDLVFGAPVFLGDDAWRRIAGTRPVNGVNREGDLEIHWYARPVPA